MFSLTQEIDLACDILHREEVNISPHLGELLPISVHPGLGGTLPMPSEEDGRCRRVFLTSSPNEDLFWAVHMLNFVIDAGVQKRNVSNILTNSYFKRSFLVTTL